MQYCPATQVFLTLLKVSHKIWIDVSMIIVWAPDEDGKGVDQPDEFVKTRADELTNHEGGEEGLRAAKARSR